MFTMLAIHFAGQHLHIPIVISLVPCCLNTAASAYSLATSIGSPFLKSSKFLQAIGSSEILFEKAAHFFNSRPFFSTSGFQHGKRRFQVASLLYQVEATGMITQPTDLADMGERISYDFNTNSALKHLGIRVSMDDFGAGYCSHSYLKKRPLTQLKIDQSFVRDIIINPSDAVIVQTIIGMANNLGLNAATEQQRAYLNPQGCLAYQSYLLSNPVPLQVFENLIGKKQNRTVWYDSKQLASEFQKSPHQ